MLRLKPEDVNPGWRLKQKMILGFMIPSLRPPLLITIFPLGHFPGCQRPHVTGSTALVWHAGREMARIGATSSPCAFPLPDQTARLVCSGEKVGGWEKKQKPDGSGCCRMRLSHGGRACD